MAGCSIAPINVRAMATCDHVIYATPDPRFAPPYAVHRVRRTCCPSCSYWVAAGPGRPATRLLIAAAFPAMAMGMAASVVLRLAIFDLGASSNSLRSGGSPSARTARMASISIRTARRSCYGSLPFGSCSTSLYAGEGSSGGPATIEP